MRKLFLMLFLNGSLCIALDAQSTVPVDSVIAFLKQVQIGYDNNNNLSFNVYYTYTKENLPNEILDSLSGEMQIGNKRYHWNISNTEVIADSQYALMLFKDDKLMYLTKSASKELNPDPLARFDSALFKMKEIVCTIDSKKDETVLTVQFPYGGVYKQIRMTINKNTGFINSTRFILKASALNQDSHFGSDESLQPDDSYISIEAQYLNYSTAIIDDSVFNRDKYFQRTGTSFSPKAPYTNYKIFIGSPNL
jgi:hypothetical protein